jgi:hypothetical protein
VVAEPDRIEAGGLGRASHRDDLGPPHVAFDLGELDADAELPHRPECTLARRHHSEEKRGLAASTFDLIFRIFHIMFGIAWAGSAFLFTVFIEPAAAKLGPQAGPVMEELVERRKSARS